MKKFILLVLTLLFIVLTYSFKPVFAGVFNLHGLVYGNAEYSVYCLNLTENLANCTIIKNGNSNIIKTNFNNAKYVKSKVSMVLGESVSFDSFQTSVNKLINYFELKVAKTEKIGDIYCVYGFCENKNFENSVEIEGQKVNIQIAFNNNRITIGTPLILGDY